MPVKQRLRTCTNPAPSDNPHGRNCEGTDTDTTECTSTDLPFCAVDGSWGPWRPVSDCSVTCGVGVQDERRECNNPAPKHGGQPCSGSTTQKNTCVKDFCPVDGEWAEW